MDEGRGGSGVKRGSDSVVVCACLCVFGGGCIPGNILQLNVTLWPWIKCSSRLNTMRPLSSAPCAVLNYTDRLTGWEGRREEDSGLG